MHKHDGTEKGGKKEKLAGQGPLPGRRETRFNCFKGLFSMGFQRRGSGSPARAPFRLASIPGRCKGRARGSFPCLSHTASVVPGSGLEGSEAGSEQSPIHPRGRLPPGPAAAADGLARARHPSSRPGSAAPPAHRAVMQGAPGLRYPVLHGGREAVPGQPDTRAFQPGNPVSSPAP